MGQYITYGQLEKLISDVKSIHGNYQIYNFDFEIKLDNNIEKFDIKIGFVKDHYEIVVYYNNKLIRNYSSSFFRKIFFKNSKFTDDKLWVLVFNHCQRQINLRKKELQETIDKNNTDLLILENKIKDIQI
jgi:hypothetical protein